jgi:uncharacterized protein (DUF1810 family)
MSLQRFLDAQAPVFDTALAELRDGRKRSHWMWFVFPQLAVLGRSATARFYGIESLDEAKAYVAHPVLGPRLLECVRAVLAHAGRSSHAIFGSPDDLKFRSCLTLFGRAAPHHGEFRAALVAFCDGEDPLTVDWLEARANEVDVGRPSSMADTDSLSKPLPQ